MTKSVKEKSRLASIRKHQVNGTQVTCDLLKVKICFKQQNFYRLRSKRNRTSVPPKHILKTLLNQNWLRDNFDTYLSDHLEKKLIDIANNLEIYELTLYPFFDFNHNYQVTNLFLLLMDKNKKKIGYLMLSIKDSENFITDADVSSRNSLIENIPSLTNGIKNANDNYRLWLNDAQADKYAYLHPDNKFCQNISKINWYYSDYLKSLGIEDKKVNLSYFIARNIVFEVSYLELGSTFQNHKLSVNNLDNHQKIDVLKNVIKLKIVDIDIPDESLVHSNIEEIENMIKIQKY